jgi:hypothetical protein
MGIVAKTLNVSLSGIKAEMVSIFPLPCLPGTYKATTGTGDCIYRGDMSLLWINNI